MNRKAILAFTLVSTLALGSARAAEDGFTSLFNGQSLDGWEGNPALWSVQNGAILGRTTPETNLKHNTFLVWKGGTVSDFELRLSYRIVNGNSGIQYRSRVAEQGPQGPIVSGYQADFEAGKTYSGILYEERGRGILAQRGQVTRINPTPDGKHAVEVLASVGKTEDIQAGIKAEDWNDYIVIARGNRLTHIINGRVTADVIDDDSAHAAKSGVLAFQVHVGPPMTVEFKNVRLKALGGTQTAEAGKSDQDWFQGKWKATAGTRDGQGLPQDFVDGLKLTFTGDKYTVEWPGGEGNGTFKLGTAGSPKTVDFHSSDGNVVPGLFEVNANELKVAIGIEGGPRPANFKGAEATSLSVVYRRQ
ncbi:MAG: DUF1080 domain-containing protein [Verrucomicrobiales bacterium]|nr:DUF1080 domain-containing protein [Verrucomicrobiales bacterium]